MSDKKDEVKKASSNKPATQQGTAKKKKTPMKVLTREEHEKQFGKDKKPYMFKNKTNGPLSVNVCSGRKKFLYKSSVNGVKTIDKDLKQSMKQCPGQTVQLTSREQKLVMVCDQNCIMKSDQVKALASPKKDAPLVVREVEELDNDGKPAKLGKPIKKFNND